MYTLSWNFNRIFLNSMNISSGSRGFQPLESKMISVHVPALRIKRIQNSLIMKEIYQSPRELMEIYFLPLFSAERCSYGIRQILWGSPLIHPPGFSLTLQSQMIRVHVPALCIKKNWWWKEFCQSSRELMGKYFLPLFSAERCSYGIRRIVWGWLLIHLPGLSLTR